MGHFADLEQINIMIHFADLDQIIIMSHFADLEQVKIICIIKNYRKLLIYFGLQIQIRLQFFIIRFNYNRPFSNNFPNISYLL